MFVKLMLILAVVREINSLSCVSDMLRWSRKNFSESRNSEINFTALSSEFDKILEYDEWNQVLRDNTTTEDLPYYVVPETSRYERGEKWEHSRIWNAGNFEKC